MHKKFSLLYTRQSIFIRFKSIFYTSADTRCCFSRNDGRKKFYLHCKTKVYGMVRFPKFLVEFSQLFSVFHCFSWWSYSVFASIKFNFVAFTITTSLPRKKELTKFLRTSYAKICRLDPLYTLTCLPGLKFGTDSYFNTKWCFLWNRSRTSWFMW